MRTLNDKQINLYSSEEYIQKVNSNGNKQIFIDDLATQIYKNCEEAEGGLLLRTVNDYKKLLLDNLTVLAVAMDEYCDGEIVGSGFITGLSDNRMEGGSINVKDGYRGMGISNKIVDKLKNLRDTKYNNKKLLMTVKPSVCGNEGMIVAGLNNGFIPVKHDFLKDDDVVAAKECCCCDSGRDGLCKYKDNTCVLLVEALGEESISEGMKHIGSDIFEKALGSNFSIEKIRASMEKKYTHML